MHVGRDRATPGGLALPRAARVDARLLRLSGLLQRARTAIPVSASRTIRSATSAVMSVDPTPVGITSTTSIPTMPQPRGELTAGPEQVAARHPARLRRAGARREGRVEHVDVDREEHRQLADDRRRVSSTIARIPRSRTSCMKKLVIPLLRLPARTPARPASSRAARSARSGRRRRGRLGRAGTSACRARPRRRRPPRRCPCGCRSGRAQPARASAATALTSGSAIEWSPPRTIGIAPAATTWPTMRSIAAWFPRRIRAGTTGASPKSTTRSSAIASSRASRCGPGGQPAARIARGPKRVPGRSEVRSSIGAPTIATSTPASSAGSWVYGRPAKVSRPA